MNLYAVRSTTLGLSWAVQATDINDAADKVIHHNREWIATLERACAKSGNDLDLDLKIKLLEGSVVRMEYGEDRF